MMEKFREALKHSDTVKVVLTGVGETVFSSEGLTNKEDMDDIWICHSMKTISNMKFKNVEM